MNGTGSTPTGNGVRGDAAGRHGQTERKRAQILGAAASLMARQGYHRTSIRDVARETGYSLAGMYHYFESKEDLLYQIQRDVFASLLEEQQREVGRAATSEEKLRALLRAHLSFYGRHADELKVCTYELESLTGEPYERIKRIRTEYFKLFAGVVAELLGPTTADGDRDVVRRAALFVFGMLNWMFMWFEPGRDGPAEDLADEMFRLAMGGLKDAAAHA